MAHVSLYRKYRSQTFAEVIGQDHITTTLANALAEDRLHHAYLFTGPRGTGKTSTARILAKSVNCVEGPTATPCNTCEHCVGITRGSSVDVIEIDAASHGGVDDVRDLRDRVAFAPASARMKVYIVDECHMLSTAGWNAFLKTVEEPPGHVMFVFATTEPHKVLDTILSRTQRFDFKRIPAEPMLEHCMRLAELEGVTVEPGAMDLVVRAGDGSARDTLSVLDQVMAFTGREITVRGVAEVLGTSGDDLLARMADLIATGDVAGLCVLVGSLTESGQDLRQFAKDAVEHLRSLLMLQVAPDAGLVTTTVERLALLTSQANRLGRVELLRAVELLAEAQAQMRRGNTRLPLEVALIKAALPEACGDPAAIAARMDRLERRTGVDPTPASAEVTSPVSAASPDDESSDSAPGRSPTRPPRPSAQPDDSSPAAPGSSTAAVAEVAEEEQEVAAAAEPSAAEPEPSPTETAATPEAPTEAEPAQLNQAEPASDEPARDEEPSLSSEGRGGRVGERPGEGSDGSSESSEAEPGSADPIDIELVRRAWPAVREAVKERSMRLHAFLLPGRPVEVRGDVLTVAFGDSSRFHAEQCGSAEWQDAFSGIFSEILGAPLRMRCTIAESDDGPDIVVADPEEVEAQRQAVDVLETEAAEAAGELPDEQEAHDRAVTTLTRDLGAVVVEDE